MMKFNLSGWNIRHTKVLAILLVLTAPQWVRGQDDLRPVSRVYALKNVTVVHGPGRKTEAATLIIRDGLIQSVGKGLPIPADAISVKADSMFVYAGFIDGLTRAGAVKPKEENRERAKDPGNPTPERAGITPQNEVRMQLNLADKSVEEMRSLGFTLAQVAPYGNPFPGQTAIIFMGGKSPDQAILQNRASFYAELTPAQGVYPATVMGVMAKFRDLYRQANLTKSYESLYASNRTGLERPSVDRLLEPFYPVIDQRQPVAFRSEKVLDVQRVLTLKNELGFSLSLIDVKEGWLVADKVKSSGAKVFLSLDLPEELKKDEKKKGEDASSEEKVRLEKRKADAIAAYAAQAAAFSKAGIPFGFSSLSAKTKDIPANLRRMISAGLTEDAALAALTTVPAQLLGLSDRVGTIDNGKIANLVVSDKPYFNEKAKVKYVFVDGVLYVQEVKEEKKSNGKATVPGDWSYTVEAPQATGGKIKIKEDGGKVSGTINSMGREYDVQDAAWDGKTLTFSYQLDMGGNKVTVKVSASIEGDSMEGTMTAGQMGSFPMKATRDPKY